MSDVLVDYMDQEEESAAESSGDYTADYDPQQLLFDFMESED